ncbi:MAG: hypothetical protein E7288_03705 [Lachnospiraceae bacterium]|nr:hypothetical protein [Lachnospiraceae bacterium]
MSYQEFVDKVVEGVRTHYGEEVEVSVIPIMKNNNERREALHIRTSGEGSNICPSIYLDGFYQEYLEGVHDLQYYVDIVINMREECEPDEAIRESAKKLMHWDSVKDSVYPMLVSQEENDQFLVNYVNTPFLDLATIYEIRVSEDENGTASSKVTYSMLNMYGISREELHQQALENMKNDGYKMEDIQAAMRRLFSEEVVDEEFTLEPGKMYVLSNSRKLHGAAGLLYEDFLKEKFGDNTGFIIPSSIHETLFVPAMEDMNAEELNQMIQQINEAEVRACERLSNHCYLWDGEEQTVKLVA